MLLLDKDRSVRIFQAESGQNETVSVKMAFCETKLLRYTSRKWCKHRLVSLSMNLIKTRSSHAVSTSNQVHGKKEFKPVVFTCWSPCFPCFERLIVLSPKKFLFLQFQWLEIVFPNFLRLLKCLLVKKAV